MSGRPDSRAPRVKNRAFAPTQITAEQLLREAQERQEAKVQAPRQRVEDFEELHEYRGRKRKEFEETIRRTRSNISAWVRYASWEASQGEYARARSVFERALDVEASDLKLWLAYTEMELKARNVQHARNLFDRAVTLLPRVDQIWYKYVLLEELLGNVAGARQVFERWMEWQPNEKAWSAYIKLEIRYKELERASLIYARMIDCHPEPKLWIKWAKWEEERGKVEKAREIFAMAMEYFGDSAEQIEKAQSLYTNFAKMETRLKEYERARFVYKYALERLPRSKSANIYAAYSAFEKQFGDRDGVESTVLAKRRIQYEEELAQSGRDYDVWFDYARLEEDAFSNSPGVPDPTRVREVYERAVAQVPPSEDKRHWRRYIFLWINYALFEELQTKDFDRARDVYKTCIKVIPHRQFTFAKIWLLYAKFELRRLDVGQARKILGTAIGMCPKEKLFKGYIEMELQLREIDRCRTIYKQYLKFNPSNAAAWIQFADMETFLEETERARAIFELATTQESLDMPELVWKSYIDFEYNQGQFDRTRQLYERLLSRTSHVKVWISFATFEANAGIAAAEEEEGENEEESMVDEDASNRANALRLRGAEEARAVFQRGYDDMRSRGLKQERHTLLEAWKTWEQAEGTPETLARVERMMPRPVKKRRKVDEDGSMEEYWDLLFEDDEQQNNPGTLKLLQLAHAWRQKQAQQQASTSTES